MADNYLEKQREQYEARKAAWLKKCKTQKKKVVKTTLNTTATPVSTEEKPKSE